MGVLILAGTRKGLFLLKGDESRLRWDVREREGLATPLGDGETVRVIAAIAGG